MIPLRALGALRVPAVGFGAMVLAGAYGPSDDEDATRALRAAVDVGSTFVDTSDAYGHNERQIGAFVSRAGRDALRISTKFGLRVPDGEPAHRLPVPWRSGAFRINADPRLVRGYLEGSLRRLGTDHVDVYSPHFPDPEVPIEDTVGAIVPLVDAGMVRHIGLSNPDVDDLRRAQAVHTITAVQVEWSMWHPIDPSLLAHCERTGVGIVAWAPLGRGFLSGRLTTLQPGDFRAGVERLRGDNLATNNDRFRPVRAIAAALGCTPAQLALAWLLHRSPVVVPIPGSRRPAHIAENAAAAAIVLDDDTRSRIDGALAAVQPAGRVS